MKRFLLEMMAKRAAVVALAMMMLIGVGTARADFDTNYSADQPDSQQAPVEESPTPEPSSIPDGGIVPAGGGGGNINNEVVVMNTVDGRSAHRAGFGVARVTGRESHNQNAAAATSSCDDCRTVAVAAQVVIIQRTNATVISPRNYAIALNAECSRCETFAAAYQYVFTTDGLVRFSAGAEQKLSGLQSQIRSVAGNEELSFPEMEAKIDALVDQMWALARSELEAVGVQGTGRPSKDTDRKETGDVSPSPSPTPTASATPSADTGGENADGTETEAEASPTPSPSAEPSESPTPTT